MPGYDENLLALRNDKIRERYAVLQDKKNERGNSIYSHEHILDTLSREFFLKNSTIMTILKKDSEEPTPKMEYERALKIAEQVLELIRPHCLRAEIAGSIRRKKPLVKDIEIVAIPKPYEVGIFESGIATEVEKWKKVKGQLPCKYTQRILPEGIKLDLFFAEPDNWGLIFAIRTGSADYSHKVLGSGWVKAGYISEDGFLWKGDTRIPVREERDLFSLIEVEFIEPEFRFI